MFAAIADLLSTIGGLLTTYVGPSLSAVVNYGPGMPLSTAAFAATLGPFVDNAGTLTGEVGDLVDAAGGVFVHTMSEIKTILAVIVSSLNEMGAEILTP